MLCLSLNLKEKSKKPLTIGDLTFIITIVNIALKEALIMNKSELIDAVAKSTKLTKKDAEAAINATLDAIGDALAAKKPEKVVLVGFGTFETKKRAARKGRNPSTKEVIDIPASKAPVFKAGKGLKDKVNKK